MSTNPGRKARRGARTRNHRRRQHGFAITRAEAAIHRDLRARQTLDAAIALIDSGVGRRLPIFRSGPLDHSAFEKIMSSSAILRQYSQAYALWKDPNILQPRATSSAISRISVEPQRRVLCQPGRRMDHDNRRAQILCARDSDRRKRGMPRIDKIFMRARTAGRISGIAAYYNVTNDPKALAIAERAARWVRDNRAATECGFRHGEKDRGGPFSATRWRWARRSSIIYAASGNREWLTSAQAGRFVRDVSR